MFEKTNNAVKKTKTASEPKCLPVSNNYRCRTKFVFNKCRHEIMRTLESALAARHDGTRLP